MGWWQDLKPVGKLGVVVLAVVIVVVGYTVLTKPGPHSPTTTECVLTTGALALIGDGLRDDEGSEAILAGAGLAGDAACDALVHSWQNGSTGTASVDGNDQQLSPADVRQLPSSGDNSALLQSFQRIIDCRNSYGEQTSDDQACVNGFRNP
jgi:hypothetical protein